MTARRFQLICYTTQNVQKLAQTMAKQQGRSMSNLIEQLILDAAELRPLDREAPETVDDRAQKLIQDLMGE